MRAAARLVMGVVVPIVLVALGPATAGAHQSPPGCSSNSLSLTLTKDRTVVRPGDTLTYTVEAANQVAGPCDITSATVTLTLPAANGTPTGQVVTLASSADFPAGAAPRVIGTVPYRVAVDPGVTDIVAEARTSGTLHDAPVDHAAQITKTVGTAVTQPAITVTRTPTPSSGQARWASRTRTTSRTRARRARRSPA